MRRLSAGTLLLGIVAILFGLMGAYLVRKELLANKAAPEAKKAEAAAKPVVLPIASDALPVGRKITLGDIAILQLKPNELAKMKINKSYMVNTQQIIGRVLRKEIKRGDVFSPDAFYPEGMGPSVAEKLKPGYRAVTISVEMDAGQQVSRSLDRSWMSCSAAMQTRKRTPQEMTIPLIEGAEVLALNNETFQGARGNANTQNSGKNSVTLAVRPEQAAALRVVAGRGDLALAIRA